MTRRVSLGERQEDLACLRLLEQHYDVLRAVLRDTRSTHAAYALDVVTTHLGGQIYYLRRVTNEGQQQ
jgi:hypothetical protein